MNNGLITAIYCRTAQHSDILTFQEEMLRNYANEHEYEDVGVYADNGFGGLDFGRPSFSLLLEDMDNGKVGVVIVSNISRLARDMDGINRWLDKAKVCGVKLVSVTDGFDADFADTIYTGLQSLNDNYT